MARKNKNKWEPSFGESLRAKKDKEDAAYIARNKARTDGIKRALNGQVRKDEYNKIIREFDDPEIRAEIKLVRHKERIIFLEKVLNENRQWREIKNQPLQLKLNPEKLKAKIQEMKNFVAETSKGGSVSTKRSVTKPAGGSVELTREQEAAIYDRAQEKIQLAHSGIIERLARNVGNGLPIERALDRLMRLGVSKLVSDSLLELIAEGELDLVGDARHLVKLKLLHPDRVNTLLDTIIKNAED